MCCGVEVDRAYLYEKDVKQEVIIEACAKAGAFWVQLITGGWMKTFSRKDTSKRHEDNPGLSCTGYMDAYH